jgi:hypothetical protein
MSSPSHPLYASNRECIIVFFKSGTEEHLRRAEAAWHGYAHVENLTAEASVLIVWPGAATRLAA